MKEKIELKLIKALNPLEIKVINFSEEHRGHSGYDNSGESHFDILIVSQKFHNVSKIERHKIIYQTLSEELKGSLHALKIKSFTPDEYQSKS
ncbi:MAG: BolA family protein [Rickettsiales bacterium]